MRCLPWKWYKRRHWQQEHERLIREMAELVKAKSTANSDIIAAYIATDDSKIIAEFQRLDALNAEACEKAEKES